MTDHAVTPADQIAISALYAAFWNRAPDSTGFGYWVDILSSGQATIDEIATTMRYLPEGEAAYPLWSTNAQLVTEVYQNVFNRAPDAGGLAFWTQALDQGRATFPELVVDMVEAAQGNSDGALFDNKVEVGIYVATVAQTDNGYVTANAFDLVTADPASVQAAEAWVDANNTGATYTLTTNIDTINVDGHKVNTVTGSIESTAAASTLNTGDTINGNNLTNVSLVLNAGANAVAPIADINNVASINVNAANNAAGGAVINAVEFDGVAKIAVTNGTNGQFVNITNAQIDTVYSIEKARSVTVDIQSFEDVTGAADTVSLNAAGAGNSTANAVFDLSGEAVEGIALATSGTNYLTINGAANVDTVTVTGSGANEITFAALAATATIDASATTGDQAYDVSGFASDLTITTGSGDDVVNFGTRLTTKDTFNAGEGENTLIATISGGTLVRPTATNVQNMVVNFAAAGTLQADLITGTTLYDISGSAANVNVTKVASTVTDLIIDETNAGTFAFGYASGSANSLDIAIGDVGTATVDGVSVNTGNTTLTNVQTVTVNSIGDAANQLGTLTAASATSLTLNTDSKTSDLTVGNLTAGKLTSLDLNATAGNITVGTLAVANKLQTLTVDATGAASVNVGAIGGTTTAYALTDVTVNMDSGNLTLGAIDADGSTSGTASVLGSVAITLNGGTSTADQAAVIGAIDAAQAALASYTFVAGDYVDATATNVGSVKADSISTVDLTVGASSDAAFDGFVTDTLSGINAVVGKGSTLTIDLIDDVASTGGVTVVGDIVAAGAGGFTITDVDAASVALVDTTGLSGNFSGNFANTDLGSSFVLGSGESVLVATAGADYITAGTGGATVTGGLGADSIDLSAGVDVVDQLIFSVTTGQDLITGFVSGEDEAVSTVANVKTAVNTNTAAAAQGAFGDNDVNVFNQTAGSAAAITTGGTATVTDFTNLTQVAAYLAERYTLSANDVGLVVMNNGTNSYVYYVSSADTSWTAADLTIVGAADSVMAGADWSV